MILIIYYLIKITIFIMYILTSKNNLNNKNENKWFYLV